MRRIPLALAALLAFGGFAAAADAGDSIPLFNGKDKTGWVLLDPNGYDGWSVAGGALVHTPDAEKGGTDIVTAEQFWNFDLHFEYTIPKGSESGVYLRGRYEIQICDDAGKPPSPHGTGAIYGKKAPSQNAAKAPGEWNVVDATIFEKDVTVTLNGVKILDRFPVPSFTGGAVEPIEDLPGPLMLQGGRGAASFRNIRIRPIREFGREHILLFDGKTKRGWRLLDPKGVDRWSVAEGCLINRSDAKKRGTDLLTIRDDFFNFQLHLEYNVAQGANSGVFLCGRYEIQILGDHGMKPTPHTAGAVYDKVAPAFHASRPGGEWQTFDALVKHNDFGTDIWLVLNGRRVLGSFSGATRIPKGEVTPGALPGEWSDAGPLRLQGDHDGVRFRNIWIKPLPGSPPAPPKPAAP